MTSTCFLSFYYFGDVRLGKGQGEATLTLNLKCCSVVNLVTLFYLRIVFIKSEKILGGDNKQVPLPCFQAKLGALSYLFCV